jgi:glycosyltransferase involved in cell wall biosynthesis
MLLTLPRHAEGEHHIALSFRGRLSEALEAQGTPWHHLGEVRLSKPWSVRSSRRSLRRLLERCQYDSVLVHGYWPLLVWFPELERSRRAWAYFQHDLSRGAYWLETLARSRRPKLLLANSRATLRSVEDHFPTWPRGEVILYPVEKSVTSTRARDAIRKMYGVPQHHVVILQASRLERWKGHDNLLDVLENLREIPNWNCWIAGSAQRPAERYYLDHLHSRVSKLKLTDRVKFIGHAADIGSLLSAADILIQINAAPEPFGIIFIEALSAGLPVVSAQMGGALEIIDQSCGLLVPQDPVLGANAVRTLLIDSKLRTELGVNGPSRALELCEPRRQARRLELALRLETAHP